MAESILASINTINKQLQGLTLTEVTPAGKELGIGSYGKVFTVKYRGKTYAAKEIHSLLLEVANPEEKRALKDNFLKECYHCSTLRHPNIVQFIGVYYPPQSFLPVMVMELMDVGLRDYIKARSINMKLKIGILYDISQGLNFLHSHAPPIIHRDLSPNNVLLSYEPVAKISDLGMAKVVKDGTKRTKSKLTKAPGTLDFMAPEALADNPTYSIGLDIFSYGGVILHVVNEEWPAPTSVTAFDPKSRQVKGFTEVERRQKYIDMMTVEAKVLKPLVIRCLDNDPAKRPAAADVLEELKELKERQQKLNSKSIQRKQEKQSSSAPGKDFDIHKVNVDEQKRLYEEARRASKQGGEGQNQIKSGKQHFQGSQVHQHQPGYYHGPRSHPHYNPATGLPHDHKNQGHHRQVSHQYEPVPGPADQPDPHSQHHQQYPASNQTNPYNLEVGSMILYGDPPRPGIIKWLGYLPEVHGLSAGIEMDDYMTGTSDGVWKGTKYFTSPPGRGLFLPLTYLRLDTRYGGGNSNNESKPPNPLGKFDLNSIKLKTFIQPPETVIERVHTGRKKGIQGHQNSCYLDSTLYGLFAFSGAFDDLFLEEATDQIGMTIKSTLQSIVNTLRHNNVVFYDHIMILRDQLDELQHIKGLKSDEKDPEEFLNLLLKHVLNVEAFLRIKRPFGTDKEFFVQLFVDGNEHHIPNTQDLLTEMYNDQQITFAKYPLRLLLQIPRYGKKFKTFKGVIPSLELDVTTLCELYVGKCMVCGRQGSKFCPDCGQNEIKEKGSYFCKECVGLWHNHESRRHHKLISRQSSSDGGDPGILRLLSVLCIETSHYVCFTRVQGYGTNEWVFFDSMAERADDVHNIPCVTQCTQQLNEWVYGTKDLTNYTSKELPQLVRRFVEDGYLCIYAYQDGIMYGDDEY